MLDLFGISNQYYNTVESAENCLSVEKIIDFCNNTGVSTEYILLGKSTYIDDETAKLLSKYKEKDVESIFAIVKLVMRMLSTKNS